MPSNSVQHEFSIVPEDTYGTVPTNPSLLKKKITGIFFALSKGTIESETINPNRQVEDVRPGNRQAGGDVSFELHYGGLDDILEALMCGTWTPRATVTATTISAAASDNSYNHAAAGFPLFSVGEKIVISGFTGTVGNNVASATVVSSTTSKIVVDTDDVVLVDDAAGESVTIASRTHDLTPGTTRRSFTVIRKFTDLDAADYPFHIYKGVEFNTLEMTIAPEAIIKGSLAILGRDLEFSQTAPSGSSFADASGAKPFDSFNGSLELDDVAQAIVTEMKLNIENGLEPRFCAFDDLTAQPKIGRTKITGNLTTYFESSALLQAFSAATRRKLFFSLTDENGNTYEFLFPSIMPTGGQVDVQGEADITIPIPFSAIYDSTDDVPHALRIRRIPA